MFKVIAPKSDSDLYLIFAQSVAKSIDEMIKGSVFVKIKSNLDLMDIEITSTRGLIFKLTIYEIFWQINVGVTGKQIAMQVVAKYKAFLLKDELV